jgi:serine/threonine-protein kinase RsbW
LHRTGLLFQLELPSNPEMLGVVRSAVMRLTEQLGFSDEQCRALTRAVDEALANVIRHAYGGRPGRPIEVWCRRVQEGTGAKRHGLEIVLIDHGKSSDRKKWCGRPLDDVRPGGLGLHFIEEAVDVMQYSSRFHTNRLRLVKYLDSGTSGSQGPAPAIAQGE